VTNIVESRDALGVVDTSCKNWLSTPDTWSSLGLFTENDTLPFLKIKLQETDQ
jgi:hypothetical protein